MNSAEKVFLVLNRSGYFRWVPDKVILNILYYIKCHHQKLNLKNPQKLNEKLQWLKLYNRNPLYTELSDKSKVKEYVKTAIGAEHLIKTLGVWNNFEEIDFDSLPDKFVLKCTHDSGSVIVCNDKNSFDINAARKKINRALKLNYYWHNREWPYKNIKPQIICEEYISNKDGSELVDYKFYCFGGEPKYFMYSKGEAEHNVRNHKFDMMLNSVDSYFKEKPALNIEDVHLPDNINEMINIVSELCKGFPFIRIDLYNIDGKILFGEMTFFSNGGFMNIRSDEFSDYLAKCIDLPKGGNH